MVTREAFNIIAEELSYTFAQEYGESFKGIVVIDTSEIPHAFLFDDLLFIHDQKIVVNHTAWVEQYPYLELDEYKNFIEEKIRDEILNS